MPLPAGSPAASLESLAKKQPSYTTSANRKGTVKNGPLDAVFFPGKTYFFTLRNIPCGACFYNAPRCNLGLLNTHTRAKRRSLWDTGGGAAEDPLCGSEGTGIQRNCKGAGSPKSDRNHIEPIPRRTMRKGIL